MYSTYFSDLYIASNNGYCSKEWSFKGLLGQSYNRCFPLLQTFIIKFRILDVKISMFENFDYKPNLYMQDIYTIPSGFYRVLIVSFMPT